MPCTVNRAKAFTRLRRASHFLEAQKVTKNARAGRAPVRLLPNRSPALLGSRRPAPTRTSMCSDSGAFPLRLPPMLGALYGALPHSTAHPCATPRLFRFIPQPRRNFVTEDLTGIARVRRFSRGPVVPWSRGPVVPWSRGPVVPWSRGPVVPWSRGPVVPSPPTTNRRPPRAGFPCGRPRHPVPGPVGRFLRRRESRRGGFRTGAGRARRPDRSPPDSRCGSPS